MAYFVQHVLQCDRCEGGLAWILPAARIWVAVAVYTWNIVRSVVAVLFEVHVSRHTHHTVSSAQVNLQSSVCTIETLNVARDF